MILLDKYYALEKADNQYQLGIIDEQTKISIIKFLNSLPSAHPDVTDTNSKQWMIDELKRYFHDEYYQRTSIQDCIDCFIGDILTKSPSAQPDNQVHLCDSCDYSYPDFPSKNDDVIFGNGIGNDNICACNKYKPSVHPELTDGQAIEHLQESGWMQNHDKQMYEMGLKERLADDSDSYDALLPSAQPEIITCTECKYYDTDTEQCNNDKGLRFIDFGNPERMWCPWAERREE